MLQRVLYATKSPIGYKESYMLQRVLYATKSPMCYKESYMLQRVLYATKSPICYKESYVLQRVLYATKSPMCYKESYMLQGVLYAAPEQSGHCGQVFNLLSWLLTHISHVGGGILINRAMQNNPNMSNHAQSLNGLTAVLMASQYICLHHLEVPEQMLSLGKKDTCD